MNEFTFPQAQADMRRGYLCGAPGVIVSGAVWLAAGAIATFYSGRMAVWALLLGGAVIYPLSIVLTRVLGHSGRHTSSNPLGGLAMEGTFWLLAGIAVAYGMQVLRLEWFFPAMLLLIGGRYLTFQTIYGLRLYWALGATLGVAGLGLALTRAPVPISAFSGAAIELVFAAVLFFRAKRQLA